MALLVGGGLLSGLWNASVLPIRQVNTAGHSILELSHNIVLSLVNPPTLCLVTLTLKQTFRQLEMDNLKLETSRVVRRM
jgi:hypothetical protein